MIKAPMFVQRMSVLYFSHKNPYFSQPIAKNVTNTHLFTAKNTLTTHLFCDTIIVIKSINPEMSQKLRRNNMKKRLFSFVLVLLMVVSVLPTSAFANSSDVGVNMEEQYELAFTVDSVELGNDDETVEVNIRVSNNGGFAGMTYQLLFDKDVLSLEQQPELGDFSAFELTGGPLEEGKHTAMLSSVENVFGNGTVVTYTFKVNPQAECGSYDIRLVTDGYANLPDGSSVKLEVLDENFQVLDSYTVSGRITIPGYTVSYDANGGSGAPAEQTKSKNGFVYISSTLPTRPEYSFEGWASDKNAVSAEYKPGDKYSANADVTLYAVWKKVVAEGGSIDIVASNAEAKAGEEVEITVSVENHLGFNGLTFDVVYDNEKLDYVSYKQDMMFSGMLEASLPDRYENKVNFQVLAGAQNVVETGALVTLTFRVLDEAEEGFAEVAIVPVEAFCLAGSNMDDATMTVNVTNGGVTVKNEILGDINHDEKVNADDAVLLLNHLTHGEAIGYKGSLDFNGDGEENKGDVVALLRFVLFPDDFSIEEAALAADAAATYTFESKLGYTGEEIEVAVSLETLESFKAAGIANISYDEDVFTLNGCDLTNEFGVLTSFENFSDNTIVALDETDIASYNGTFAVLRFTINENAEPGTYTITGTPGLAGEDRITSSVSSGSIEVKHISEKPIIPVEEVDIEESTAYIPVGGTMHLDAIITPEEATNKTLTWTSSDEEVATVDNKGVVTAHKNGTAKITATSDNGEQDTCTVNVIIPADAIDLSGIKATSVAPTKYITLKAKAICEDGSKPFKTDVTYEIIDGEDLATIDASGKFVAGETEGDVTVRVTAAYGTETAYTDIVIKICLNLASKVTLNKTKAGIALGYGDLELSAVMVSKTGECTDTLTWSVDKPEIATVDENGVVTGHSVGKAKVTAMSGSGKKATCTVTVGEIPTTKVDISGIKATSVAPAKSITLKAKAVRDDKVKPVSTAVDYEIIEGAHLATINAKGKFIAGEEEGEVVVRIKAEAGTADAYEIVTVRICSGLASKVTLNKTKASMALGYGDLELSATMVSKEEVCEDTLKWSVDKPEIATVDQNGVVTAHSAGKVKVTAMAGSGKKATCTVTIGEPATAVELSSLKATSVAVGKTLTLKGKAVRDDGEKPVSTTVEFEILEGGEFATIDAKGKLTGVAEGEVLVRVKAEAGTEEAYEDVVIRVCVPATKISLNMTTASIEEGEELQLSAVIAPEDQTDTVVWTSANETVATVDENGLVTAHSTGIVKITAKTGSGKSASCTVTVGVPATKVTLDIRTATVSLSEGELQLSATILPEETTDKVVWTSADETIATVDENGLVTVHSAGKVKITATAGSGKSAYCTVIVTE